MKRIITRDCVRNLKKLSKISGIYKITNPSSKVYIGQSIDLFRRLKSYFEPNSSKNQTILKHSFDKSNAPKQQILWDKICKVLNIDKPFPILIHAGLLLDGKTGKKISKRDGSGLVSDYEEYNTEAILNWIFKMGWSHKDSTFDKQYPTLNIGQMIDVFNGGNINQSNTKVFKDKLDWLNKKFNKNK